MRRLLLPISLVLVAVIFCGTAAAEPVARDSKPTPGVELAQTISMITGVAISPLLGVGAVGAWKYFEAKTPQERAKLPWFANPWFWSPALLLVAVCFIKDTAGVALPTALKKPLDIAETIENKISGLVATGAFVPIAASIFESTTHTDIASLSALGFAAVNLHWLYNGLMIPVAMVAFFIVFLASNAINILILLSPFTTVDAALKTFRTGILASVAITSWANPWVGAAWALMVILISWLIAGWSFRLSHLGIVFVWDFLTGRRNRFRPSAVSNRLFLARPFNGVPARTYGALGRNSHGEYIFEYRPWLVLARRTLNLPPGKYQIGRGILYSEILRMESEGAKTELLLPPRYLGHESELANIYGFFGVRDIGLRAMWKWLKSMSGFKATSTAA